jgi:hypothetical protein
MAKIVHRRGTPGPNHPNGMGQGRGMGMHATPLHGATAAQSQIVRRSQKVTKNSATKLAKGK